MSSFWWICPDLKQFVFWFCRNNKPRLSELYAPPEKIMTQGCFDDVRTKAVKKARWLLVNIHKYDEFVCQLFMRECLKHEAVQEIISENFVFWHVDFDSKEGLRYITHYKVRRISYIALPCSVEPRRISRSAA